MKPRVTHLTLPDPVRQLAAIRAAQAGVSLSDYIARVVREDAERTGLLEYLDGNVREVRHAQK